MRRALCVVFAAPAAMLLIGALAFRAAVAWWPYPTELSRPPEASTWIEDRSDEPLAVFASSSGQWQLPLTEQQISPHLLDAIVAVEDSRFYEHGGVDWRSVGGAVCEDIAARRERRGASTITMQLQRLREPMARSLVGKIEQAVRATQIEQSQSKRAILVEYLNRAPFGGNLVGAGAASWRYFGKPCRELSIGQAALLAGLPQSPNRSRPDRFPQIARVRRDHVLDRMVACGMLTVAQRNEAANEPIDAQWRALPQEAAGEDGLLPAMTRLALSHPGQRLRVNIDPRVQRMCALAARSTLAELAPSHIGAAAVVVLDTPTGKCLASVSLVSEEDESAAAVDLTQCARSSGSTLKPFIYAAAFEMGICTPRTMLEDAPGDWSGYEPANYDRGFRGTMPASEALAQSRNLPAIGLLSRVGVDRAVELMAAAGFSTLSRTPDRYGLPLAIGGAEVTPMELAEAYASLARGGQHRPATLVCDDDRAAAQPSDKPLAKALPGPAMWPTTCLATLNCLADPDRTARVFPAAAAIGPAWKTGTSGGHRDAWCAAVTPRLTVVVWLGNPDGCGADRLVGQEAAAPLALQIVAACDPTQGAGFAPATARIGLTQAAPIARRERSVAIQLISPADGQQIIRDPSIPADAQRCPLRARMGELSGDEPLWWFVDGRFVGRSAGDSPLWWPPSPGVHEVRVVDADGRAASANLKVQ
jgi:penicillin-binding protein 1C